MSAFNVCHKCNGSFIEHMLDELFTNTLVFLLTFLVNELLTISPPWGTTVRDAAGRY